MTREGGWRAGGLTTITIMASTPLPDDEMGEADLAGQTGQDRAGRWDGWMGGGKV